MISNLKKLYQKQEEKIKALEKVLIFLCKIELGARLKDLKKCNSDGYRHFLEKRIQKVKDKLLFIGFDYEKDWEK